jgi:hypothetical protein
MVLEREVEEQLVQSHQGDPDSLGMSLVYIFAELDLLAELVDAIDELVDLTRQLFGTSAWLDQTNPTPMHSSMQDDSVAQSRVGFPRVESYL